MPKADLVLEGGGVKGLGLVGAVLHLMREGYTFPRVAGTSAGRGFDSVLVSPLRHDGLDDAHDDDDDRDGKSGSERARVRVVRGPRLTRLGCCPPWP